MSELRIQFENAFPVPAHWIEFDEKRNKYYCPYVADAKAHEYQAQWEVWQSRQSEIDQLKAEKEKLEIKLSETKQVYRNVVDMELAKVEKLKAEKVGLEKYLDAINEVMNDYYTGSFDDAPELAGLISAVLGGTND